MRKTGQNLFKSDYDYGDDDCFYKLWDIIMGKQSRESKQTTYESYKKISLRNNTRTRSNYSKSFISHSTKLYHTRPQSSKSKRSSLMSLLKSLRNTLINTLDSCLNRILQQKHTQFQ